MLEVLTNIFSTTVLYSTPLILAAIGGLFSERSGVVNIGLEGLMTIGAFTAAVGTIFTGNAWIGLLLSVIAGIVLSLPHAIASITFKADQVVSGVALNFLSLGLSIYFVKYLFAGSGQTPKLPDQLIRWKIPILSEIPIIGPSFFEAYPVTYIAFFVAILSYFIIYRTTFGMRLRATGEHPHAVETSGIRVISLRYIAVMISGALAAIGGAGLSIAIGSGFSQSTVAGHGFIALAALIFGKWKPLGALAAATFFGFVVGLALTAQLLNLTQYVPSEVLVMMPYLLTIFALAGFVGNAQAPAALGKPYEKGVR